MYDAGNDAPEWVLPPELWFPDPTPECSGPLNEDPYSPDPYAGY